MANPLAVLPDQEQDAIAGKIDLTEAFKLRYRHGLSYQQIGDRFGVTKQAVQQRLSTISRLLPDPSQVELYRKQKSEMLDALEYKVYENMLDPDKLKDASFNNLAYGFQNICTQNRLEKGLATDRLDIQTVSIRIDDLRRAEDDIIKTINARVIQDVVPTTPFIK